MAHVLGINVNIETQKTLATALVVTAITKAKPPVATYTPGTPPADGDVVVLAVQGMSELDGQAVRVDNRDTTANTFELEGLDATDFATFTSGTASVVSAWNAQGQAQDISVDEQTPDEIDVTTLKDTEKKIDYGLLSAVKGRVGELFDPTDTAQLDIRDASKAQEARAMRVTFADGQVAVLNAKVAMGDAFSLAQGQAGKTAFSFTLRGHQIVFYAS